MADLDIFENENIPIKHIIKVENRRVYVDNEDIIQNNVNTDIVELNLDSEWIDIKPILILYRDDHEFSIIYEGSSIVIPKDLISEPGFISVSVIGYDLSGTTKLVTVNAPCVFRVIVSGKSEGIIPEPNSTDILGQILSSISKSEEILSKCEDIVDTFPDIPEVTSEDEGKTLQVINGKPSWEKILSQGIKIGEGLKQDSSGVISVNTVFEAEQDNTLPISSGAVYTIVGNVDALLKTI